MWIVFSYVWLPFMVLPVYGAIERIPSSYIEASGDLGATRWPNSPERDPAARAPWRGRRKPILPRSLPPGDFITPLLVGGPNSTFIGNTVEENIPGGGNVPLAAAFATAAGHGLMGVYLVVAKRLSGAFEAV